MSAYMEFQQARADQIRAVFAAGVKAATQRDDKVKAIVSIAGEVERHAGAIDPTQPSAASVLVDLVVELAQGVRMLANIMDADAHPAPIILDYPPEGPEWPASLLDSEVTP